MDHHITILVLLVGLTWGVSGQFRNSRRKQQSTFPKPRFSFPPPRPVPVPANPTSVEVQQAEVRSEEFIPHQELETPFQNPPQFPQPAQFHEEPRNSFRQNSRTTTPSPKENATPIPIIRLEKQQSLDGSYKSNYETGNLITAEETGFLKNIGNPESEALVQFGSYSYTDPDGQVVSIKYTADEGGFRATGSHIPTPPPVPPEVQKGLDIIFEQIRQEAEQKAKEKKLKNIKLESENYPEEDSFENVPKPQNRPFQFKQGQGRPQLRQ